jgi:hypothetical protein
MLKTIFARHRKATDARSASPNAKQPAPQKTQHGCAASQTQPASPNAKQPAQTTLPSDTKNRRIARYFILSFALFLVAIPALAASESSTPPHIFNARGRFAG